MHVCLVTSGRPLEVFYGGEEKFTISLCNWIFERGNIVTLIGRKLFGVIAIDAKQVRHNLPTKKSFQPRAIHLPYPIFILGMIITSLLLILKILATNKKLRISIIHAQDTGYGGLSAIIVAKILKVPVIISSHGLRFNTISQNLKGISAKLFLPLEFQLDSFVSKRADGIIVVSSSEKRFFNRLDIKKENIVTIPIGIKISNFKTNKGERQAIREELHIQQEILIGFVGRLSPEKNLVSLLEAFGEALKRSAKLKMLFVGTGPLEKKLKMLSYTQGLVDKIIFTGSQVNINRFLSALDIFVIPSYTEGFPTSLLEAMSSCKAIIASNIMSIREIVRNGVEAVLINPYKVEELKQAILLLYDNPTLRTKLGHNARLRAELYDIDKVYNKIIEKYESLVNSKNKTTSN